MYVRTVYIQRKERGRKGKGRRPVTETHSHVGNSIQGSHHRHTTLKRASFITGKEIQSLMDACNSRLTR
jgi:hypothetical protein